MNRYAPISQAPITKKQNVLPQCRFSESLHEYLQERFLEDHTLESLSKEFACNANKLMALFKGQFDKTIFEFLTELKMNYALILLKKKKMKVLEVSRIIGYKNPNHFATAFKRKFGICPSEVLLRQING